MAVRKASSSSSSRHLWLRSRPRLML
jgi:hypothetical protein